MKQILLMPLTLALLMTAACQKTRDAQFESGQGENLYSIADYKGLNFEIQTGQPLPETGNGPALESESDAEIKINLENPAFTDVSYETSSPLVKTLMSPGKIKARANFKYQGQVELDEKNLTLVMLAKPDDVPAEVADYAQKQADGTLRIPLLQFAVEKLVNVDLKKSEMGETTSTKVELETKSLDKAKFIKIDPTKGKVFATADKRNLLRAAFFAGEWSFSQRTLLPGDSESGTLEVSKDAAEPKVLKFVLGGDSMRAVDASLDLTNSKKSEWSLATTMILDIDRIAYKANDDFTEGENKDLKLRERPLVRVHFETARTRTSPENARLVSVGIQKDLITFILEDKSNVARPRTEFTFQRKSP